MKRLLLSALLLAGLSLSAFAAQHACPDLAAAKQVNACPTEEELKHTYSGFCSDDKKVYGGETDNCMRYADYRAMKNNALWESADGAFDGYVSCDLPKAKLQAMKAALETRRPVAPPPAPVQLLAELLRRPGPDGTQRARLDAVLAGLRRRGSLLPR